MKTKFLLFFLLLSGTALNTTQAQFRINVNIGSQPVWGPVGYDHVENYYLPDIESYYNVPTRQYTYFDNGRWVTAVSLPPRYRNYDLYSGYKVVINEQRPYLNNDVYRTKYGSYKNRHDQVVIRDSREIKYYEIKDHPRHGEWKENGHDNRNKNHDKGDKEDKDDKKEKGHGKGGKHDNK